MSWTAAQAEVKQEHLAEYEIRKLLGQNDFLYGNRGAVKFDGDTAHILITGDKEAELRVSTVLAGLGIMNPVVEYTKHPRIPEITLKLLTISRHELIKALSENEKLAQRVKYQLELRLFTLTDFFDEYKSKLVPDPLEVVYGAEKTRLIIHSPGFESAEEFESIRIMLTESLKGTKAADMLYREHVTLEQAHYLVDSIALTEALKVHPRINHTFSSDLQK